MNWVSSGVWSALLTIATASANAQQPPEWCRIAPPPSSGRYAACGQGRTANEADREALAGIARQLRASVRDTLASFRTVVTEGEAGGLQTVALRDTSAARTQVTADAVLRNVRIERRAELEQTHYALAVLDLSRELADLEELVGDAEDSLKAGRIASALSLCRNALILADSLPWSAVHEGGGALCTTLADRIDRSLSVELRDLDHAVVRIGRAPVAGVRLMLRRNGTTRHRWSSLTDRKGIAALPTVVGYVGGGPVTEEIDLDWAQIETLATAIPFRPRATRTFKTQGVLVTVVVSGALPPADRLALTAALTSELHALGFDPRQASVPEAWLLRIEADLRNAPPSLGQIPTAVTTVRWEVVSQEGARLGQGGTTEIRGVGTDQVGARASALARGAEIVSADLEMLAARRTR